MKPDFDPKTESALSGMASGGARVLVTGGSGYLGSMLVEMLVARGFHVTVVDNLSYSQNTLFNLYHTGRLEFIFGDVTNEKFMQKLLSGRDFEFIFPLAAIVGFPVSEQKPEVTWLVNHKAVLTVLSNRKKGSKVIFPTTNSGYGATSGKSVCTEDSPLSPISEYGKSKAEAERAVMAAGDAVVFRLATLYGFSPRMRTDLLVNDFVHKAVSERSIVLFERKFKRNFLHVRDAARGFLFAMANWDAMKGRVYNLGHPDYNISKEELCLLIKKQVPGLNIFHAEIGSDPDKRNYVVSNERVLKAGFTFNYTLEDGIAELVQGYRAFKDFRFKNY
ncbi:GDP-mannose 4,6-dehydratase [uncultured archaeon]|nr:GDP-mannose 4,6-dehydratase [uncultured archaeon]